MVEKQNDSKISAKILAQTLGQCRVINIILGKTE